MDTPRNPASSAPRSVPAVFRQGQLLRKAGDIEGAVAHFRASIVECPDYVPAYNNLANALQTKGDLDESASVFEQALQLAPHMPLLHCNFASLRLLQGKHAEAAAGYSRAIALKPDLVLAHHNLAKAHAGMGDFAQALASYQAALSLDKNNANLHYDLGNLYQQHGDMLLAIECYKAVLQLDKKHAQAWNSLGAAMQSLGETGKSEKCYLRAIRLDPDFELPHSNLAQLLENTSTLDKARVYYETALKLTPTNLKVRYHYAFLLQKQADWHDYPARLLDLQDATREHVKKKDVEGLPGMIALAFPLPPSLRKQLAVQLANQHLRAANFMQGADVVAPLPATGGRLRIGYVSPDFRDHAVGSLLAPLFAHHDKTRFEVFCYSLVPVQDAVNQQFRAGSDKFHDCSLQSALAIAERVKADGIHVLVDLAGYTAHSVTPLFALQPAPVQVQYMGYPGTMGAAYIPYMLADTQLVPVEHQAGYSETMVYLDNAWATAPPAIAERQFTRAECGLPEDAMVYCCHNGTYKIEPTVFKVWMQILQAVPKSVLWLLGDERAGNEPRLRQQAEAHGIDPARVVFAYRLPPAEYLARYRVADLFLDTFTYNAGATAVGALAAGLPVLTCPGDHYVARMGASVCTAVGMHELICGSHGDYQTLAITLGNDPVMRAALRRKLRENLPTAPLFQPESFIRNLEQAFLQLWSTKAGKP